MEYLHVVLDHAVQAVVLLPNVCPGSCWDLGLRPVCHNALN